MIAALIFFVGIVIACIGALSMASSAMPSFGGPRGNELGVFIAGAVIFVIGLVLVFYAGTWV